jgi:cytochrome bd ubiquinol oxidase subunit II
MTEIIILVLGISILLYVLLGGADFGAGIVEIVTGKKSVDTISKAIAPVWEANHVWLILVVVILFNGFPYVYASLSIYLHIPLLMILIGIILRGTAFTFRYYDAKDDLHHYFTALFRISSLITPLFLGIVIGAISLGKIPGNVNGTFFEIFISPWLNFFTLSTGIFLTTLFGWLASVYLIGEAVDEKTHKTFTSTSFFFFIFLFVSGLAVFLIGEFYNIHYFTRFVNSAVAIVCVVVATLIIPLIWINIKRRNSIYTRLWTGIQTACIIAGWFAIQFPVMIFMANGPNLTVWNSQAPDKTMTLLVYALLVGIILIFPAFAYLFKVFKFETKGKDSDV